MILRCAAYARYSSDLQSPRSIEDQLRICREYAHAHGFVFLEEHIYVDEALSGVGADRPGLSRLLDVALSPSRPFDVILLDDSSRLARNTKDALGIFERLNFAGIRLIAVSQGIDSDNEQAHVLVTVHGMVDSLYVKELAKKTHRGLEGLMLRGQHTGGRCFGYDSVPVPGETGKQLVINEGEAAVVRRIFEMSAEGQSLKTIAKTLNRECVPPPRPRTGKKYGTWCPTCIREMLRRDLYRGQVIWNSSRFVKVPGTNKRVRRARPQSEWRIVPHPELQIVSNELWQRVKERQDELQAMYGGRKGGGILIPRSATSPYLLSGILKCGLCGGNLIIISGYDSSGHHPRYGCSQHFNRGACSNSLTVRRDWLEGKMLPCILRGEKVAGKLVQIGKRLARMYARATAPRGTPLKGDEVVAGQPTVLVQFDEGEGAGMPKSLDFDSDHLAFMNSTHCGVTMNLWLTNAGFGDPRNTRIALLRLSAEHQCLKFVLRDITDGNVNLDEISPRTERLQEYLSLTDRTLSKNTRFGVNQTDLIRLTQTFETLSGGSELVLLRQQLNKIRPQIRTKVLQLVDAANSQQPPVQKIGPDFDYQGSFDELEYQSFMNSPRPLLDLAWTAEVLARLCPAVCLIEIPSIGRSATGFLVAKDLILTNWHVVEEFSGDDKAANLANMRMTFTFSAQKNRSFRLAPGNSASPLVVGSPPTLMDFVLLRVSEDVVGALSVVPFHCDAGFLPVKRQAINIIQHPDGGPLKLSSDVNGVSGVDKDSGKVQYISLTEPGSSGSPCIDSEKRLVAIHHAEVNGRVFSVREGILISSIYAAISPFLV